MTLSTKILICIGCVLTFGVLGFIVYKQNEISQRQLSIETQVVAQKQLFDSIVRSQNTLATKDDFDKFAKDNNVNLKSIQDDLDKLHAEMIALNVSVSDSYAQHQSDLPSTFTGPSNTRPATPTVCKDGTVCPSQDQFGFMSKQQDFAINEDFGSLKVPFGSIGFSAWQQNPWNIDIKPREYSSSTVVGTDENQRTYFYNKFSVNVDGKNYDIPVKSATTKQAYPDPKMSWLNPRLYLGIDTQLGLNPLVAEATPSLNVQFASYGQYKNQPNISILQLGVGYGLINKRPQLLLTPFSYNVGKSIPLMNNFYVGPSLSVATDGNVYVGAGIRVGL